MRPTADLLLPVDRGKTVTKRFALSGLGLLKSENQIPQVVENFASGDKPGDALETVPLPNCQQIRSPIGAELGG